MTEPDQRSDSGELKPEDPESDPDSEASTSDDGTDAREDDAPTVQCTLTEPEARERLGFVEAELVEDLESVTELDDGYRFEFAGTDDTLTTVATFVALESDCCSFADFEIAVPSGSETTRLTVTGPAGTKELGREGGLFDLEAVPDPV